jgi:hypothetical protein
MQQLLALFPYVGRLYACGMEMVDSGLLEALIEQRPHRARGRGKTLSSLKDVMKRHGLQRCVVRFPQ